MGLLPMLTVGKRELGQCITDLAVWHVMSGMGEWARRRMGDGVLFDVGPNGADRVLDRRGYKDFAPTELVGDQ